WKKDGHTALARKVRKDRGRLRTLSVRARAFVEVKYCVEKLNVLHSYEALVREWPRLGDGDAPSYATVRRYVASLPTPAKTLCREGKEAFTTKCAPFILREAPPTMQWWILDHRQLDVFAANALFLYLRPNQMYRPWLTAVYDWGSRAMVGYAISP